MENHDVTVTGRRRDIVQAVKPVFVFIRVDYCSFVVKLVAYKKTPFDVVHFPV